MTDAVLSLPRLAAPVLLADIGATNARFALVAPEGRQFVSVLRCRDHTTLVAAARAFLEMSQLPRPRLGAFAVAGPVQGRIAMLTNHPWAVDAAELEALLGLDHLMLMNDFTAQALALPWLGADDLQPLGCDPALPLPRANKVVIGPGTGLGVAALVPDPESGWLPISGEGGHVTMPAVTADEQEVLDWLNLRHGHVSAERLLSGMGIENIDRALSALAGEEPIQRPAADVTAAARAGETRALRALELFANFLGTVTGNLALTFIANGGVYIGGGIIPKLGPLFNADLFRTRFEAKGRMRGLLVPMPTLLITHPLPAMLGLAGSLARLA